MVATLIDDLGSTAAAMRNAASNGTDDEVEQPLSRLEDAAAQAGKAWSGSSLGYHACVYYRDFEAPPPGAHFSSEWGFHGMLQGTTGDWEEYQPDDVINVIRGWAENPDLADIEAKSEDARKNFVEQQANYVSAVSAALSGHEDEFLRRLMEEGEKANVFTKQQAERAQLPTGGTMTRDSLAATQGQRVAPHQQVLAQVASLRSPFIACDELAAYADRAAAHIERLDVAASTPQRSQGDKVFIGHGRSALWREFKDFLQERLGLPWDEFNREPVAGTANVARLGQMLDDSGIAFLILTAEDEHSDGSVTARQNVVHEAGLFQGRLGFARAIVLLEEDCQEFSNIEGLGQIRFPAGNIAAAFEEARRVLEREGFLDP